MTMDLFEQVYTGVICEGYIYDDPCNGKLKYNKDTDRYDVDGSFSVLLNIIKDGKLLFEFGEVKGTFYASNLPNLTSLEGFPTKVRDNLIIVHCDNLETLQFITKLVGKNFYCLNNKKLKLLDFAPEYVGGETVTTFKHN